MTPESPPGAVARIEIDKAAFANGWRIEEGVTSGWIRRRSASAPGRVAIATAGPAGPWFVAVDHPGVAQELDLPVAELPGPGVARFRVADTAALHDALSRIWDLAVALPDHPLRQYQRETAALPRGTEAERLVIQRKGQDIFRASLMAYWSGCCPLTGITDSALLRASHMKPWADCESDAERLDPYNGLLLSALWDAAFDEGLVTFDDAGRAHMVSELSDAAREALGEPPLLSLTDQHHSYLAWHRDKVFVDGL